MSLIIFTKMRGLTVPSLIHTANILIFIKKQIFFEKIVLIGSFFVNRWLSRCEFSEIREFMFFSLVSLLSSLILLRRLFLLAARHSAHAPSAFAPQRRFVSRLSSFIFRLSSFVFRLSSFVFRLSSLLLSHKRNLRFEAIAGFAFDNTCDNICSIVPTVRVKGAAICR